MGLVVGFHPLANESVGSYGLRLAERNHCRSQRQILNGCGCEHPAYVHDHEQLDRIGDFIGIGGDRMLEIGYPTVGDGDRVLFFGQPVDARYVRVEPARVCPRCVAESGFQQAYCDLLPLAYCPTHHVALVDTCPHCRRQLSYLRQFTDRCDCGYHLARILPEEANSLARRLLQLVVSKVDAEAAAHRSLEGYPKELLDLDLDQTCRMIVELGHQFAEEGWLKLRWPADGTGRDMRAGFDAVAGLLDAFPSSFEAFLEKESPIRSGPKKLHRTLIKLHEVLHERLEGSEYDFLRDAYASHARQTWSSYFRQKGQIAPAWAKEEPIQSDRADLAGVEDVAALWGFDHSEAYSLVQDRVLTPVIGPGIDAMPHWAVPRGQVLESWNAIRRRIEPRTAPLGQDIGFRTLQLMASIGGVFLPAAVRAVVDGEVAISGLQLGKVGFESLLVDFESALEWVRSIMTAQTFSPRDAAQFLAVNRRDIGCLLERGFIENAGWCQGGPESIPTSGVRDFASRTIFAARWARRLKVTSARLQEVATAVGLKPIVEPGSGTIRPVIYWREDAAALASEICCLLGTSRTEGFGEAAERRVAAVAR